MSNTLRAVCNSFNTILSWGGRCALRLRALRCSQENVQGCNKYSNLRIHPLTMEEVMSVISEEMLAENLSTAEDLLSGNFNENLTEVKLSLERAFHGAEFWEAIKRELKGIETLIDKDFNNRKDGLSIAKNLIQTSEKITKLLEHYRRTICPENYQKLEHLAFLIKEWGRTIKVVIQIPREISPLSSNTTFKRWADGLEGLAETINKIRIEKIKSSNRERIVKALKCPTEGALWIAENTETNDSQRNRYRFRIILAANFLLQKLNEIEKQSCEDLVYGEEPFAVLLRKSKERIASLGWAKSEEEIKNMIIESYPDEENEEDEEKFESNIEYLNKILGDN